MYCSALFLPSSMMASLIHTNREASDPVDTTADDPTFRPSSPSASTSRRRTRRQLTLDTSFRPVKKAAVDLDPSSDDEDPVFDAQEWGKGKEKSKNGKEAARRDYDGPTTTLVVAPVSLLHQWESELKKSAKKGSLRVFREFLLYLGLVGWGSGDGGC